MNPLHYLGSPGKPYVSISHCRGNREPEKEKEIDEVVRRLLEGEELTCSVTYAPFAETLFKSGVIEVENSSIKLGRGTENSLIGLVRKMSALCEKSTKFLIVSQLERAPILHETGNVFTQLPPEFLYKIRQGDCIDLRSHKHLETRLPTKIVLRLHQRGEADPYPPENVKKPTYAKSKDDSIYIGPGYRGLSKTKRWEVIRCFGMLQNGTNLGFDVFEERGKRKYRRLTLASYETNQKLPVMGQKAIDTLAGTFEKLQADCRTDFDTRLLEKCDGKKTLLFMPQPFSELPSEGSSSEAYSKGKLEIHPIENTFESSPARIEDGISKKEKFVEAVTKALSKGKSIHFKVSYLPGNAKRKYSLENSELLVGQKTMDHVIRRMDEVGKPVGFILRELTPIIPCSGEEITSVDPSQLCYKKTGDPEKDIYCPEIRPTKIEMMSLKSREEDVC